MENKEINNTQKNTGVNTIIIILLIIVVLVGAYFIFFRNSANVKLDLNAISNSITTTGKFDEMAMMDITKDVATSIYNIPESDIEEIYGKMPMMNVQASTYLMIKAVDGKAGEVKQKLEEYGNKYQEQWETYLPAQLELVKNRIIVQKGNYVYMIIAENATELEKLIK
ncbi:MAG: DUF4358 domain-containing protein [Clostridia bacterium]|nr:DUF4358 domain-containing protein [Clostridia bacterium]